MKVHLLPGLRGVVCAHIENFYSLVPQQSQRGIYSIFIIYHRIQLWYTRLVAFQWGRSGSTLTYLGVWKCHTLSGQLQLQHKLKYCNFVILLMVEIKWNLGDCVPPVAKPLVIRSDVHVQVFLCGSSRLSS